MKNLFVILLLLCMQTSFAQIQKGTMVVGGGLSLGGVSYKYDSDIKSNNGSFELSGIFEKFMNERTAFGFGLNYAFDSNTNSGSSGEYGRRTHLIIVGPRLSHYIPIVDKLYLL